MEIIFEQCPTCNTHACAFAVIDSVTRCPMCAPVPDKEPHDYRPLFEYVKPFPEPVKYGRDVARADIVIGIRNLISGVCCGDTGNCGHECGIS